MLKNSLLAFLFLFLTAQAVGAEEPWQWHYYQNPKPAWQQQLCLSRVPMGEIPVKRIIPEIVASRHTTTSNSTNYEYMLSAQTDDCQIVKINVTYFYVTETMEFWGSSWTVYLEDWSVTPTGIYFGTADNVRSKYLPVTDLPKSLGGGGPAWKAWTEPLQSGQ